MANLPVKWYDYRFHGLPKLSGTPGTLTDILDCILVDGFGTTNIVTASVTDKKATLVLEEGFGFFARSVVALAGFTDSSLNTEYRVISSGPGVLTVEMDVPNGPLTLNNAKVKYAPLGWIKVFSDVSKRVYKPSKVDALEWVFYIDDTRATWAEIKIGEQALSISSLTNKRPYNFTMGWPKNQYANTAVKTFGIVGDPYCFYYKTDGILNTDFNQGALYFVGQSKKLFNESIDNFNVFVSGKTDNWDTPYVYPRDIFSNSGSNILSLRDHHGIKNEIYNFTTVRSTSNWSGYSSNNLFSNDNFRLLFTDNYFYSSDRRVTIIPGMVTSNSHVSGNSFDYFFAAEDNTLNRELILVRSCDHLEYANYNSNRHYYFDITGPWR